MLTTDKSRRKEIADYTTIGLALGLSWVEARRIARQIVAEKELKR